MKQSKIKMSLLLVAVFGLNLAIQSQVTIGSGEKPVSGALLQLKEKDNVTNGGPNADRGLMMPRVNLTNKKELYPMFLQDPENPASGPKADYSGDNKPILDKEHTGMIVYNLTENDDEELCKGLNQWDGEQWNCFERKMGNAVFDPVECTDISVNGVYVKDVSTTSANFLIIKLNVEKGGVFVIMVDTDNGYSFYLSGVTLCRGKMTVNVPCQGTPAGVKTDELIFRGVKLVEGCKPVVDVVSAVADYSLNCSSILVEGNYLKDTVLSSSNAITLKVAVSKPGSYRISTPETNGISFSHSGIFSEAGTHSVKLIGSGIPTVKTDFPITINANAPKGNNTCSAIIPVTLPAMNYAIIGSYSGSYSWGDDDRVKALANKSSFGPEGKVKVYSLTRLWTATTTDNAVARLNEKDKPDIILYFAHGVSTNSDLAKALKTYMDNGGCVIYGSWDYSSTDVNILMKELFNMETAIAQSQLEGLDNNDVYPIASLPNDPVVNGPFGNLSSTYWGEDYATTASVIIKQLPPNSVQICTARSASKTSQNAQYSIVWYNDSMNFFYFGDSTGASIDSDATVNFPTIYDSNGLPVSQLYGPPITITTTATTTTTTNYKQYVYNSALELNAVAWALKKAAVSGINPH